MVGSLGRIDQSGLRTGKLKDQDWEKLAEAVDRLKSASIFIDETPALNAAELRARARRMARQFGGTLGLIVVDYLQLMSGQRRQRREPRHRDRRDQPRPEGAGQGTAMPGDRAVAAEPQVETRNDKRPMMSDLRESGAIEQDADVIMFIYRDEYYNKDGPNPTRSRASPRS
jgi:replicative DNA helicase